MKLARSIVRHQATILAAIEHNLSNGLIESTNTKIRLITRVAYGLKTPSALIALALLSLAATDPNCPAEQRPADPLVRRPLARLHVILYVIFHGDLATQ